MVKKMFTKQVYYTENNVKQWMHSIMRQMNVDDFKPDYIVGISRGGLTPATMLSYYLDIPMCTLNVSFREGVGTLESNLWMAEDAFGYITQSKESGSRFDIDAAKNILIVDDINDSGHTIQWIKDDWENGCFPFDERWEEVWGHNVRFAVMVNNESSDFKDVDYVGLSINKLEEPVWCVFPAEEWWR